MPAAYGRFRIGAKPSEPEVVMPGQIPGQPSGIGSGALIADSGLHEGGTGSKIGRRGYCSAAQGHLRPERDPHALKFRVSHNSYLSSALCVIVFDERLRNNAQKVDASFRIY